MNDNKQLWILTGGNGAGKSTFYRTQLEPRGLPFINADIIAAELYPEAPEAHSYQAAQLAEKLRYELIQEGRSFCFETVFSLPSKIDFLAHAKSLGYIIILVFVHLPEPQLNKARIAQRIEEGGHRVPDDKVESRIPRTLANIKAAIPIADQSYLLDNSSATSPFELVVSVKNGAIQYHSEITPDWIHFLLEG